MPARYHSALVAEGERNPAFADAHSFFLVMADDHPVRQLLERLSELDAAGIDVAVISVPPPAALFTDSAAAREATSIANDELLAACASAPERFVMLAALPLPDVEGALAEVNRLADHPAVRGLIAGVNGFRLTPDRLELQPLLARASELSYPLVIHPAGHEPGPFDDFRLGDALEPVVWTSVVGLRFVLSGLLDEVPELALVVPHLGGVLPYLTQRLVELSASRAEHDLTHYLTTRLYYDTCSYHPPALRCAIDTVGADRIMLGSDYPFRGSLQRCVEDVRRADLDDEARTAILGGTAARWFHP